MSVSAPELSEAEALQQLQQLVERNRTAAARGLLKSALPAYPESIGLMTYAAWVDYLDDDNDGARETIAKVLEQEPEHYSAHYLLALIFEDEEDFASAEQELISLLKDYPEDGQLYAVYGRVMLSTMNFEKAQRLADESLRLEPSNETALNVSVLTAFVNAPGEETRVRLEQLVREHPEQIQTTIRLIQVLLDQGKTAHAYELAREMVLVQPDNKALVELASELKAATHWSMKPLWPMQKFGWAGSIGLWVVVLLVLRTGALDQLGIAEYGFGFAMVFLGYVVYSWVWPPIIRRIVG